MPSAYSAYRPALGQCITSSWTRGLPGRHDGSVYQTSPTGSPAISWPQLPFASTTAIVLVKPSAWRAYAMRVPSGDQVGPSSLSWDEWVKRWTPVPSALMT